MAHIDKLHNCSHQSGNQFGQNHKSGITNHQSGNQFGKNLKGGITSHKSGNQFSKNHWSTLDSAQWSTLDTETATTQSTNKMMWMVLKLQGCCKPLPPNPFARSHQMSKGWGEGATYYSSKSPLQTAQASVLRLLSHRMRIFAEAWRACGMWSGPLLSQLRSKCA